METGMLGTYHPESAVDKKDGKTVTTLFRDTVHKVTENEVTRERRMLIDGRVYRITSVFLPDASVTPTDKLLSVIDADLEKETHTA
jgi:hypothetical protein